MTTSCTCRVKASVTSQVRDPVKGIYLNEKDKIKTLPGSNVKGKTKDALDYSDGDL